MKLLGNRSTQIFISSTASRSRPAWPRQKATRERIFKSVRPATAAGTVSATG